MRRICAGILCLLQKLGEHGNLLVPWQGVAGEIYLFAVLVRQGNCLVQLLALWKLLAAARILKLSRPR